MTGAGVKIGNLEEKSNHADRVLELMKAVATNSSYYELGNYTTSKNFYENEELLISKGVNIINMSAGDKSSLMQDPDGNWVTNCSIMGRTDGANLKVIEFEPRKYGTGTYEIQVVMVKKGTTTTNFGLAWR